MVHERNPALGSLEGLAGDWDMELSNASFIPDPSETVTGHVSFEWVENGAFLVLYMGDKPPGTPDGVWLIGRNGSNPTCTVLYYDSRKVSRVSEMSFSEGIWKMWMDSPGFLQRFERKLSKDGNTIAAHWEKSFDGKKWEHDFNITYTRLKRRAHEKQ